VRLPRRAAELAAALMFAVMLAIFVLKVTLRYGFDAAPDWSDEVAAILFVWIVFWAAAFIVPLEAHIRFDLVLRVFPPGAQRAIAALRHLVVIGLFGTGLPAALGYILFLHRQTTPVLGLPLDWVYACFGAFLVAVSVRSLVALWRLLRQAPSPGIVP
jgi:TRAP-type C4-dicarboxylate transport system permease small subunit